MSLGGTSSYRHASLMGAFVAASTVTPLPQGIPIPDLVIKDGQPLYFKLDVPAGESHLAFNLDARTTSTGDVMAYVARDVLPTTASTRCAEPTRGTLRCRVSAPAAGTWYVMVTSRLSTSAYGASLVGFHGAQVDDVPVLLDAAAVRGLSVSPSTPRTYKLMVPEGATYLQALAGSEPGVEARVQLALRKGSPPTATAFDCRTSLSQTQQTRGVEDPAPGFWYVTMTSDTTYQGKYLTLDAW